MAQNPSFIQATKFSIKRFFTTITGSKTSLKSSLFLSFHGLLKDNIIAEESKGQFSNIFPFITNQSSCKTINIIENREVEASSNSTILLSLGHNFPVDPGAVGFSQGKTFRETEAIAHQLDSIVSAIDSFDNKVTIDVLPWNELRSTISLINDISKFRLKKYGRMPLHISLHSDYAVPAVDTRPLTFGVYYGSEAGRKQANVLVNSFATFMKINHPNSQFKTWLRSDTQSPHGRLGIIRDTAPVSLILESDFMSRHFDELKIVQAGVAYAVVQLSKSL